VSPFYFTVDFQQFVILPGYDAVRLPGYRAKIMFNNDFQSILDLQDSRLYR
jgi:hypothetical protein